MLHSTLTRALGLVVPLALGACGRDQPAQSADDSEPGEPGVGMTPASRMTLPEPGEEPAELGAPSGEHLSDGQIIEVLEAINTAEVDQGKVAIGKAKNPEVRRFVEMMIAEHGQALKDIDEVESSASIEPAESGLVVQLRVEATAAENKLRDNNDASFDKLYMLTQVDAHRKVLDTIDAKLVPHTQNQELRQLLQTLRPRIASHLEHARMILSTLD